MTASWYNSAWSYRLLVRIEGKTGAGIEYPVKLAIGSASGGDFNLSGLALDFPTDLFFTRSDGLTPVSFWVEDPTADPVTVWVKIEDSLESDVDIYLYFGAEGVSSTSDGEAVFTFFDHFEGDALDTSKWPIYGGVGTISVANSIVHITNYYYLADGTYTGGYAARAKQKVGADITGNWWSGFARKVSDASSDYRCLAAWWQASMVEYYYTSGRRLCNHDIATGVALDTAWHVFETRRTGTADTFTIDDANLKSGNCPHNAAWYAIIKSYAASVDTDWFLIRKFITDEPVFKETVGDIEGYICIDGALTCFTWDLYECVTNEWILKEEKNVETCGYPGEGGFGICFLTALRDLIIINQIELIVKVVEGVKELEIEVLKKE